MVKKNKKQLSTLVHLANMRTKDLEICDIDIPERYKTFAVDKKNGRFAFIFQEAETSSLNFSLFINFFEEMNIFIRNFFINILVHL